MWMNRSNRKLPRRARADHMLKLVHKTHRQLEALTDINSLLTENNNLPQ